MPRPFGLWLGFVLAGCGGLWAVEVPVAVSPARVEGVAQVEARCPSFDWGNSASAISYELVVYRIGEEGVEAEPVWQQTVPGTANGWTPSLERCLERGGRYAWSVRALGADGDSEWSPPSLFEVAPGPSEEELAEALRVVREYLAKSDSTVIAAQSVAPGGAPSSGSTATGSPPQAPAGGGIFVEGAAVLSGWERKEVAFGSFSLAAGATFSAALTCPMGKVAVGGGGTSSNLGSLVLTESRTLDDLTWVVGWKNVKAQAETGSLSGTVICVSL